MSELIKLTECPRDAMQGWEHFIPTALKIEYLQSLLKVGFDVLDFGSFVSPKAIPQLADTADVLAALDLTDTKTKLLAIIANTRGAEDAVKYEKISYLGFPFSISETFQMRNTNKTIGQSLQQVEDIQNLCIKNNKELVIYISMGFGNPYGDHYSAEIAIDWVRKLSVLGIKTIAMSDTVGVADPNTIEYIYGKLVPEFPAIEIGAHFHSSPATWQEKIESAYKFGCRRYDSAMKGIGGCPMAEDQLVGNIATENLVEWAAAKGVLDGLDFEAFRQAAALANSVFI